MRKPHSLILFILLGVILFPQAAPGAGMSAPVGVRITGAHLAQLQNQGLPFEVLIDYGSFLWGVLPANALPQLRQLGLDLLVYDSPFTHARDQALTAPSQFKAGLSAEVQPGDAGLYLLQFQGPTRDAWLAAVEGEGLEIVQYLHPFTYLVWGTPSEMQKSLTLPFLRRVGPYRPSTPELSSPRLAGTTPLLARVIAYGGQDLQALQAGLKALGGAWLAQSQAGDPVFTAITIRIPGDQLEQAADLPGIYALHPLPLDGGARGELGAQVNAGNLDNAGLAFPGYLEWLGGLGLTGAGVAIANVDSGIDGAHPDLAARMLPCVGLTCGGPAYSSHGTHTAGIMAGDGRSGITDPSGFLHGLGVAPGAGLVEQLYESVWTDPDRMLLLMQESAGNQAVISGNSWGPSSTPQGYDYDTRLVDIGVRDADPDTPGDQPLTYVLSVMNGGGGISSQGTPDEAKNLLSVGSTYLQQSDGSQDPRINDLSANSAHGPALDGRTLPLLVAPGYYVDSTLPGASYGLMGGTSMASPAVTGAAALFYEYYRGLFEEDPSPALVKAAFLPVAHDLAGHLDADRVVMGHPFNNQQGWGRLDISAVLDPAGQVWYFDQETLLDETGASWSTTLTTTAAFTDLRAMLVWTDAPGHGTGGEEPAWVNDLDLGAKVDGHTYYGNHFGPDGSSLPDGSPDGMNNTEGLFLEGLPPGTITFTVTAANISGDGVPNLGDGTDQDFALVIYAMPYDAALTVTFPIFFR